MNKLTTPALLCALLTQSTVLLAATDASALESRVAELERQLEAVQASKGGIGSSVTMSHNEPITREWLSKEYVTSGNTKLNVALSGHINRAITYVNDSTDTYFRNVDNDASHSRARVTSSINYSENVMVGTKFEYGMYHTLSSSTNQNASTGTSGLTERVFEIYVDSKDFGRVTLGQGSNASDGIAELTLAGTWETEYSYPSDAVGGFYLRKSDVADATFTANMAANGVVLNTVFDNFDGGRTDRVRFDSTTFSGLQLHASIERRKNWDMAATHTWSNDMFETLAGIAHAKDDDAKTTVGSFSLLHKDTGLNLTYNAGKKDTGVTGAKDKQSAYMALGWNTKFNDLGMSYFSVGRYIGDHQAVNDDESKQWGFGFTQKVDAVNADLYMGYKKFEYYAPTQRYDDLSVFMVGARVLF